MQSNTRESVIYGKMMHGTRAAAVTREG